MFDLYGNLIWLLIAGIIIAAIRSRSRYRKSEQATEDPLVALGNRMARIEAAIDRLEQRLARLEGATEPQQLPERETASAVLRRPLAGAAAAERAGEILPQVSPEAKAPSSLEVATKPGPTGHPAGEAEAAVSVAGQSSKVHGFVARRVRALKGRAAASEKADTALAQKRRKLEKLLLENWTGILGAVVVVAGVTFVGIYTALRLAPFYRFLLMLVVAFALIATAFFLARHEQWRAFASWLRSAGAAILLFACAASGGLPGLGLQWIEQPLPALLLLLAGIGFNLYLAYASGTQVFATLHVLLSMLPLAIVPASSTSLAIASAVALFGVTFGLRGAWDRHLALVIGGYLLFHLVWVFRLDSWIDPEIRRLIAAGCSVLVLVPAALAHHRKAFAGRTMSALTLAVHLSSWVLLALSLFVYVPYAILRGVALLVAATLAYRLGRRAQRLDEAWLYRSDVLAAQGFLLLALASGYELGASIELLLLFALAETIAFRRLIPRDGDSLLNAVASILPLATGLLLLLSGIGSIFTLDETGDPVSQRINTALVMLVGSGLALFAQRILATPMQRPGDELQGADFAVRAAIDGTALGLLAGALVPVALSMLMTHRWLESTALVAVAGLALARRLAPFRGRSAGSLIALVGAEAVSLVDILSVGHWPMLDLSIRILPLIAMAAIVIRLAGPGLLRQIAIVTLGINLGAAAYLYLEPVSPLMPGVAWLMMSLPALELANRLRDRDSTAALALGYAYLLAFATAYALVIIQSPAYIGPLRARLMIELFAVAVIAYWWLFRPRVELAEQRGWRLVHPYFVEVLLIATAVLVVVEIPSLWWAVAWATIALFLLTPLAGRVLDQRAPFYSLIFYWVSVIDMAVVLSTTEVPSSEWHDRPEIISLIAIGLQILYAVIAHKRLVLRETAVPGQWAPLARLAGAVAAHRNLYVYYPLFAGIALFFYWRFDRSLLTLLWAAEAFVIFVLSAWLRESQFRYIALAGLAACLARLVLIDMAESNLAVRGVVFIGVGLLMLGMNAIYNRFHARFQH